MSNRSGNTTPTSGDTPIVEKKGDSTRLQTTTLDSDPEKKGFRDVKDANESEEDELRRRAEVSFFSHR